MSSGATRHRLRRALRETRARLRHGMGLALRPLLGGKGDAPPPDPGQVRRVLVVRINGRLGNALFMTPLLHELHARLPQARIDLATSYPHAAALLAGFPGLGRVIVFPHKGGAGIAGRYLAALRAVRRERYDLAIDPDPFSTSDRIVLAASHSGFRLGFASDMQWAPLDRAIPAPPPGTHMARSPVDLLLRGLDLPGDPGNARLTLPLTGAELARGRQAVESALARPAAASGSIAGPGARSSPAAAIDRDAAATAFGFFAHATGFKNLGPDWWRDFWSAFLALVPGARPLEFLPGAAAAPVNPGFATLNLPAQRDLTAAIAGLRLFICADGGPMHLAGSTDTPTIGLFNGHSDPRLYGPLKPADRSIDVRGLTPPEVARQVFEAWQSTPAQYSRGRR